MSPAARRALIRELARRRSVVIGCHGVGRPSLRSDPRNLRMSPDRFRALVDVLRSGGFRFVTVAELAAAAAGGVPPPGLVALSFDDGMEDNHSVLLPILREYGIPATVYVVTGLVGRPNPWTAPGSGARMMTADELRELHAAGVELGAHTVSHPDLSTLDRRECLREMLASREAIERLTGQPVRTFAYPFCRYGDAALAAARDAGFAAAVTCEGRGSWNPLELKRAMLTGNDGPMTIMLKLVDVYQPLFDSWPGRTVRVATRAARGRVRVARERRA